MAKDDVEFQGPRLKRLRLARKLSQRELGRQADVSYAMIARIEMGQRQGSDEIIDRLAQTLGVTSYYLRSGDRRGAWTYVTKEDVARGWMAFGCPTCRRILAENWEGRADPT